MIVPVILSGGSGTRLWPLSRELYPKQLLSLTSEKTMLQETLCRLDGLPEMGSPVVICNHEHRFLVAEQMRQIDAQPSAILLEPVGRNTAPAVAMAALSLSASGEDPLMLVLPADHVIVDHAALHAAIAAGCTAAESGSLVTFGIVPTNAETGYGYIRRGMGHDDGTYTVAEFVEKPDLVTATSYLESGDYLWNSGMFLFRTSSYLEELRHHAPDIHAACQAVHAALQADLDFLRMDAELFAACPSDSIDYAVMEKTERAALVPLDAGWSDVGSWSALWEIGARDTAGNVVHGDVLLQDSADSYLYSSGRILAAVGVRNHVVVETADAVLVAHKDKVQDVKAIVEQLRQQGRSEVLLHRRVNRPWGAYEGVDRGERFQVKRITVNPGAKLSSQMHHHRAEHWVVVKGTARVTNGDRVLTLAENESTYIPVGEVHCLENPGKIPLEIIEVQTGGYLGEDDIVRFEDRYGREGER